MLVVIVLVVYFLAAMPRIKLFAHRLAPQSRRARVILIGDENFDKVGGYMLGNVLTSRIAMGRAAGGPVVVTVVAVLLGADLARVRQQVIELKGLNVAETIVGALTTEERRQIVEMLVDAAAADGKLSPHELKTMNRISKALGI